MNTLPLHVQFDVIKLKLDLNKHPEDAQELAVEHFSDYLEVVERYKQLLAENKKNESLSLFPVQTQSHGQLQRDYDELLECYMELLAKFRNLAEENKALYQLVTEQNFNLPSSVKRRRQS